MRIRLISCSLVLLVLLGTLCPDAGAISTSADAAILMDANSGRVLYQHNADERMLIASTTKIMTALVALRDGNLKDLVTVSPEAAATEGSSMYLTPGEQLTLEALLYGLMLSSGNDAAIAIAEHVGGSVPEFVERMNALAGELGMADTSFANPNGLDHDRHYSTARDMARLAQAAIRQETLLRIVSTRRIRIGGRTLVNHNKLLSYVEGCIGLKTGYTRAAGRTLVSCVERNGQRLIAVTLRDGNDWADHAALYEYGFTTYPGCRIASAGEKLASAPLCGAEDASVPLLAGEAFSWPLDRGEKITTRVDLPLPLVAPIPMGRKVGEAVFSLEGKEVGRVDLLCGAEVLPKLTPAIGSLRLRLPE